MYFSVCLHTHIYGILTHAHREDPVSVFLSQTHSEPGGTGGFTLKGLTQSTRGKDKHRSAALCAQRDCGLPGFPHPFPAQVVLGQILFPK